MQNPIGDAQAIKSQREKEQKEHEERQQKAQLLRIEYNIALLTLGLDESLGLDYRPEGLLPRIRLYPIDEETAKRQIEELRKLKQDLEVMGQPASPIIQQA